VRGSPLISFASAWPTLRRVLIAAISDTHLPRGSRRLPDTCLERLASADLILHVGDISTPAVLEEIEAIGPPVRAVHGNVDSEELRRRLPEALEIDADGARIAMVHDAGPSRRRIERMRARFPDAAAVLFGHSHIPLHEEQAGFQIFNPGSPTDRRRQPRHTMGIARAAGGQVTFEHVTLD
jgi:putative phosphoesterase